MRALKTVAVTLFAVAVVCAVALIAAWPLGATPSGAPSVATPSGAGGQVDTVAPRGQVDTVAPGGPPAAPAPSAAQAGGGLTEPLASVGPEGAAPSDDAPAAVPVTATTPTAVGDHSDTRGPADAGERIAAPTPTAPSSGLGGRVAEAARSGIRQSVVVLDRSSGAVVAQVDPDRPLPSMSLAKLFIAVDLLDRSGGPAGLDPNTADTLWRMITVSDDNAASTLWIGGGDGAIVTRIAARFHLAAVRPPTNPGMWGDTTVTARDVAQFLRQALADPLAGPWLAHAMESAADTGADGFDQNFGMNAIAGAGSKQGWGCCLRGVRSLGSAGFTADRIVVALSTAAPDTAEQTMRSALTVTARAALRVRSAKAR